MSRLTVHWRGKDWVLSSHGYIEPPGPETTPHQGRIYLDELTPDDWLDIVQDSVNKATEEARSGKDAHPLA